MTVSHTRTRTPPAPDGGSAAAIADSLRTCTAWLHDVLACFSRSPLSDAEPDEVAHAAALVEAWQDQHPTQ
jgi:hypothetical protein